MASTPRLFEGIIVMLQGLLAPLSQAFERSNPVNSGNLGFHAEYRIPSHVKGELEGLARLPGHVSREQVKAEAFQSGKAEAAAKLLAQFAKLRQRRMRATANLYKIAAQHQQNVLRINEQMMQTDENYGRFIEEHLLNAGVHQQSLDGYQQGFQNAKTLVG